MPHTPRLLTERLILQPLVLADADAIQRLFPQWGQACLGSNDVKPMGPITGQLVDQAEFPIQISLHGFPGVVGAFVRAAIAVDAR